MLREVAGVGIELLRIELVSMLPIVGHPVLVGVERRRTGGVIGIAANVVGRVDDSAAARPHAFHDPLVDAIAGPQGAGPGKERQAFLAASASSTRSLLGSMAGLAATSQRHSPVPAPWGQSSLRFLEGASSVGPANRLPWHQTAALSPCHRKRIGGFNPPCLCRVSRGRADSSFPQELTRGSHFSGPGPCPPT